MSHRTRAGLRRFPRVGFGDTLALVAPASSFPREDFERGVTELSRLGFPVVYEPDVFARTGFVAGRAVDRALAFAGAWRRGDAQAVLAVRGGYGSVETLPFLNAETLGDGARAFVGYSDVTSLHIFLNCHLGFASVYGAMIDGRLAKGPQAYDPETFMAAMTATPIGELCPEGLEVLRPGEASGPLLGGTLTQVVGSLGTPYNFAPPAPYVLLIEDVGERPYRVQRALMQLRLSGLLARASAVVIGQMPGCDEPNGSYTARGVMADVLSDFPGPVLFGLPAGHTTTPCLSLPLGVEVRVVASARPALVFSEAAAS